MLKVTFWNLIQIQIQINTYMHIIDNNALSLALNLYNICVYTLITLYHICRKKVNSILTVQRWLVSNLKILEAKEQHCHTGKREFLGLREKKENIWLIWTLYA